MARVSVPKPVPLGTPTMSLVMEAAPVVAPALIELQHNFEPIGSWADLNPLL